MTDEKMGEFIERIPVNGQWHRVVIDGKPVEVKNYGVWAGEGES